MGMTIEDCISKLIEILEEATEDENAVCYVTDIDEPTLKMAIDTMRKYQKIQEIVQSKTTRVSYDIGFRQIKKVVEDGRT